MRGGEALLQAGGEAGDVLPGKPILQNKPIYVGEADGGGGEVLSQAGLEVRGDLVVAEVAGGVGFGFRNLAVNGSFRKRLRRRKSGRHFGGGGRFSGSGTRAAATATTTATAASAGAARGGGQVQIGLFVRHKF